MWTHRTGADAREALDAGGAHAGDDVGGAVREDRDRGLGKGHAEGGEYGVGPVDRRSNGGRVVDIAGGNLEALMLNREDLGAAGKGDHIVALVERQLGEESPGRAIGAEHCKLHQWFLSTCAPGCLRSAYVNKDATMARFVTSPREAPERAPSRERPCPCWEGGGALALMAGGWRGLRPAATLGAKSSLSEQKPPNVAAPLPPDPRQPLLSPARPGRSRRPQGRGPRGARHGRHPCWGHRRGRTPLARA